MKIENVRAYYVCANQSDVRAVDDVSFQIHKGEVFGIAGESGCGKSTLAAVISLNVRPPLTVKSGNLQLESGSEIRLTELDRNTAKLRGKLLSLLPQRAMDSLNPSARIRNFVVDVIRSHDPTSTPAAAVERARDRFEQLSLPSRVLDCYPHQLSGGMRQRVVAVISTLLNPEVLVADEPTSALDVSSQKQLINLLLLLLEKGVISRIAFITHDLPMLSNVATRIGVMYAGKMMEEGTTDRIIENPRHPYTRALIASTLDPDPSIRGKRLLGIQGMPPDLRAPPSGCLFHTRCPSAMEICKEKEPPKVGTADQYAVCWLLVGPEQRGKLREAKQ
jgi:peptide/nickel transport system ATP-binding protein